MKLKLSLNGAMLGLVGALYYTAPEYCAHIDALYCRITLNPILAEMRHRPAIVSYFCVFKEISLFLFRLM